MRLFGPPQKHRNAFRQIHLPHRHRVVTHGIHRFDDDLPFALLGKGHRTRSVVMPDWAKAAVDAWAREAGLTEGLVFRDVRKGGHLGDSLSEVDVSWVIKEYGHLLGFDKLAAHDLRRTYAKLARKGGADLEPIRQYISCGIIGVWTLIRTTIPSAFLTNCGPRSSPCCLRAGLAREPTGQAGRARTIGR